MVFSSLIFLCLFLPIVMSVYYLLKPLPVEIRNTWLLAASLLFYAWGEPYYIVLLMVSILMNYVFGLLMGRKRKAVLITALLVNFGILYVFKYLSFSVQIVNKVWKGPLTVPSIALPIGISFFTFQAVSYVIDVYREKAQVQYNPLNLGLYISFFPQLVAGPIVRYDTVAQQLKERKESLEGVAEGLIRFCRGFGKKVLLANVLGNLTDQVFALADAGKPLGAGTAWVGAVCYTLQIFFDFSGYSDMAIGLGKIFGFTFEENFDYPYIAGTVTDFWRRWHISLSRWFRDYVYIPLGGSKVGTPRLVLNLLVVWSLTGIWHGANWTFIFWGLWYFAFLTTEKLLKIPEKITGRRILAAGYRVLTLLVVILGWVVFRSAGIRKALVYMMTMFGLGVKTSDLFALQLLHEGRWVITAGILLSMPLVPMVKQKLPQGCRKVLDFAAPVFYALVLMLGVSYLVMDYHNPFIYFNF